MHLKMAWERSQNVSKWASKWAPKMAPKRSPKWDPFWTLKKHQKHWFFIDFYSFWEKSAAPEIDLESTCHPHAPSLASHATSLVHISSLTTDAGAFRHPPRLKPSCYLAGLSRLVRLIMYLWRTTTEAGAFRHPPHLRPTWNPEPRTESARATRREQILF